MTAITPHPGQQGLPGPQPLSGAEAVWLSCAEQMASAGKRAILPLFGTASGRVEIGRGAGGDQTLQIDRACEEAIREVLAAQAPFPYRLVSEEAGVAGSSDAGWQVVVDPVDGSLNAKHGLSPCSASIAVADGVTMGDVRVGYVEDYLRPCVFSAVRGVGLVTVGAPGAMLDPLRFEDSSVEVILLEAGRPDRHQFRFCDLSVMGEVGRSEDLRIRQIGSLALALCYVATGAADVLVAAVHARSVDLVGGLLVLKEAGGGAVTLTGMSVKDIPLDLEKRSPFVAWRAGLDHDEMAARARGLLEVLFRP